MELKIYIEDVELDYPLFQPESDLDIMLDILQPEFRILVENAPILKYFGIDFNYGK